MAGTSGTDVQELKLKISYSDDDAEKNFKKLSDALEDLKHKVVALEKVTVGLNDLKISRGTARNLEAVAKAVASLSDVNPPDFSWAAKLGGIKIDGSLGKSLESVVAFVNGFEGINTANINNFADELKNGFDAVAKATSAFEGNTARIPAGTATIANLIADLGKSGETVNRISEETANNLKHGFKIISDATKAFGNIDVKIPPGLGKEVAGLAEAVKTLSGVTIDESTGKNLDVAFGSIASAAQKFTDINAKIPVGLGKGVVSLLDGVAALKEVGAIGGEVGDGLEPAFAKIAAAVSRFTDINAKIPVGLGKGVLNLVNAVNEIKNVNELSAGVGETLDRNFSAIARAVSNFEGISGANFGGIASLVAALTQIGKVKPFDNTVVKNAELLANAINKLDAEVRADNPRLKELAAVSKQIAPAMRAAGVGAKGFGDSLKLINFAAFVSLARQAVSAVRQLTETSVGFINAQGDLQNSMGFFNQSLRMQSEEIGGTIAKYYELGGIDFSAFTNNVAILNQMYKGYGIAAEDAAKMALNMTQAAYDASYALGENGRDLEEQFQRSRSIAAGYTRSAYYWGVDVSMQNLANMEFSETEDVTTKAGKALAAYNMVLGSTIDIHNQYAREMDLPSTKLQILANRVREVAQSIGYLLTPAFKELIDWALVAVEVVRLVVQHIAALFGQEYVMPDYKDMTENIEEAAGGAAGIGAGLNDANDAAKALKRTIASFDEVYLLNDNDAGSGKDGGTGGFGGGLPSYDFSEGMDTEWLDGINTKAAAIFERLRPKIDWILEHLDEIKTAALAVASALLTWKIASGVMDALEWISKLKSAGFKFGVNFSVIGLAGFLSDFLEFRRYLDDFIKNGPSFHNVAGMISEFAGMLGDAFILLGNLKLGGVLKIMQGVGEIIIAIEDIANNGLNWDNALTAVRGLTNIAIGIGVFTGRLNVAGWALAIQGLVGIIREISDNWEAVKKGDWSGVDKAVLIVGALEILGGIAVALDLFAKIKGASNTAGAAATVTEVTSAVQGVSAGTSALTSNLAGFAKNLALGIVIIAEIAAAALLLVGAIWLMGMGLEQVGMAWEPVIANADTVIIAIGIGAGLLAVVGTVTAVLGSVGKPLIANIAIGVAILAELGIATGLFLFEIWGIGKGLDEIGKAWQPVLDNGDTIREAILLGTGLLVAIGVVTAALGVAAVASAGALPLAIELGTAMLVALAAALVLFIESLVAVADELRNRLAPALSGLNPILPSLQVNMGAFVDNMVLFADETVKYTKASSMAGFSATVDTIIGWFTKDPIAKLSGDVSKQSGQFKNLNDNLTLAVPRLIRANGVMIKYAELLESLNAAAKRAADVGDMKSFAENNYKPFAAALKTAFDDLEKIKTSNVANIISVLKSLNLSEFKDIGVNMANALVNGLNTHSVKSGDVSTFISAVKTALTNAVTFAKFNTVGEDAAAKTVTAVNASPAVTTVFISTVKTSLANAVKAAGFPAVGQSISKLIIDAINGYRPQTTLAGNIKNALNTAVSLAGFGDVGRNIAKGVIDGITNYPSSSYMTSFINRLKREMRTAADENSPSKLFRDEVGLDIGAGVVLGVNEYKPDTSKFGDALLADMSVTYARLAKLPMPALKTNPAVSMTNTATNTQNIESRNVETERQLGYIESFLREFYNMVQGKNTTVSIDGRQLAENVERRMARDYMMRNTIPEYI